MISAHLEIMRDCIELHEAGVFYHIFVLFCCVDCSVVCILMSGTAEIWKWGLDWGLSIWSLHVLPVHLWLSSRYSGFLAQSKNRLGHLATLMGPLSLHGIGPT